MVEFSDIAWSHEVDPLLGVTDDRGFVYIYAMKYGISESGEAILST